MAFDPVAALAVDVCDLGGASLDLSQIHSFVAECAARLSPETGEWLSVTGWNSENGNQQTAEFATIGAALDAAAPDNPTLLIGLPSKTGDRAFAAGAAALARATDADGDQIGVTKETLETDFADYAEQFDVDRRGAPTGAFRGMEALALLGGADKTDPLGDARLENIERFLDAALENGVTSFLDPAATPQTFPLYEALIETGAMNARATLAHALDPLDYARPQGAVDFDRLMLEANRRRAKFSGDRRIKADALLLAMDAPRRGDPFSNPPTLPLAATSDAYRQPIIQSIDPAETEPGDPSLGLVMEGYVDLQGDACAAPPAPGDSRGIDRFLNAHGFDPAQCATNEGTINVSEAVLDSYIARADAADFAVILSASGDRAVAAAARALEALAEGAPRRRHVIFGLDQVAEQDIALIRRSGAVAALPFPEAGSNLLRDIALIPYIDVINFSDKTNVLNAEE